MNGIMVGFVTFLLITYMPIYRCDFLAYNIYAHLEAGTGLLLLAKDREMSCMVSFKYTELYSAIFFLEGANTSCTKVVVVHIGRM
jgi:hypothetical protein